MNVPKIHYFFELPYEAFHFTQKKEKLNQLKEVF